MLEPLTFRAVWVLLVEMAVAAVASGRLTKAADLVVVAVAVASGNE